MNFCKAVTRYKLALAGRGVQAWVDYCNSARCYDGSTLAFVRKIILEALYVCAEAVKQSIIHAKCGKFSKFRTSDITSVGLIFMHNTANFWVQQQKVVLNFVKSRFTTYSKQGGCYSGQALVCAILEAHIAFVIHKSVAQHSDKQRTVALTVCSQHRVVGWVWRCSKLHALRVTYPIIAFQLFT